MLLSLVIKCSSPLETHKWFPKAYITRYVVASNVGNMDICTTSIIVNYFTMFEGWGNDSPYPNWKWGDFYKVVWEYRSSTLRMNPIWSRSSSVIIHPLSSVCHTRRLRNHPPTPRSVFVFIHPDRLDICVHPPFSSLLSAFVSPSFFACVQSPLCLSDLFPLLRCVCVCFYVCLDVVWTVSVGECVHQWGKCHCSVQEAAHLLLYRKKLPDGVVGEWPEACSVLCMHLLCTMRSYSSYRLLGLSIFFLQRNGWTRMQQVSAAAKPLLSFGIFAKSNLLLESVVGPASHVVIFCNVTPISSCILSQNLCNLPSWTLGFYVSWKYSSVAIELAVCSPFHSAPKSPCLVFFSPFFLCFFLFFPLFFFPLSFSSSKEKTSGWRGVSHSNRMLNQCDIENRWGAGIFGADTELEKHGLWERRSQGYGGWLSERSWGKRPHCCMSC